MHNFTLQSCSFLIIQQDSCYKKRKVSYLVPYEILSVEHVYYNRDDTLRVVGGDDDSGDSDDPGGALHQQMAARQGAHDTQGDR